MAHPYTSGGYGAAPPYPAQQQYYSPYQPQGFPQSIHTPPGLLQPSQPPSQPVASYQPSPSANTARFDANTQLRSPAPPFPFPPNTFNSEILKHLASAGLPPPPPPSLPPVPIPSGYPQFSAPLNASGSSPYPQTYADGPNTYASGFHPNEKEHQSHPESFATSIPLRGTTEYRTPTNHDSHSYVASRPGHKGNVQPVSATRAVEREDDQVLPSFGSRSDIDHLFATAQRQAEMAPVRASTGYADEEYRPTSGPRQSPVADGNISPYDPTRPAALPTTVSTSFSDRGKFPPRDTTGSHERRYDTESIAELKQAAKSALRSLGDHNIRYPELAREGLDPQILLHLYGELGVKIDFEWSHSDGVPLEHSNADTKTGAPDSPKPGNTIQNDAVDSTQLPIDSQSQSVRQPLSRTSSGPVVGAISHIVGDVAKEKPAPSPSLERKDRIAQLLAAKTGRGPAVSPHAASPPPKDQRLPIASVANLDGSSFSAERPISGNQTGPTGTSQAPKTSDSLPTNSSITQQAERQELGSSSTLQAESSATNGQPTSSSGAVKPSRSQSSRDTILAQSAFASLIPGLFMSSTELDMDDATQPTPSTHHLADQPAGSLTATPLKRPLQEDSSTSNLQPHAKRSHLLSDSQTKDQSVERASPDDASEGEIVEDGDNDPMAVDTPIHVAEGSSGNYNNKDSYDQQLLNQMQAHSTSGTERSETYQARPSEMTVMRHKINENEKRQQLRATRSQGDSPAVSATPTPSIEKEAIVLGSSPNPKDQNLASSGTPSSMGQKSSGTPKAIPKLTPAQLAERAAALKAEVLRQRARRQQVLQQELPDLNAEVANTALRLEKARANHLQAQETVARCRIELERAVTLETELAQEVRNLLRQLQNGRSGQKQYSDELHQIQQQKLERSPKQPVEDGRDPSLQPPNIASPASGPRDTESPLPTETTVVSTGPTAPALTQNQGGVAAPERVQPLYHHEADERDYSLRLDELKSSNPAPVDSTLPAFSNVMASRSSSEDPAMDIDQESDGSASMSDSGSERDEEDYEPAAADVSQPMQQSDEDSDEYDPEEAPVQDLTPLTGTDAVDPDEHYQPTENAGMIDSAMTGTSLDEAKLANGSLGSSPGLDATHQSTALPQRAQAVSSVSKSNRQDDIEKGIQLTATDSFTKTQDAVAADEAQAVTLLSGASPPNPHFVPYKTPLSSFKTFRFHQDFNDTVRTGFRSLTYSNNIDPSRPLCPTELSGETCTDESCEEQHFRQLGLTDDKILVQMSSANDIKDKAQRDQYLVGLKQVIADLRQREVKQFENVAQALSAYRREFFAAREELS